MLSSEAKILIVRAHCNNCDADIEMRTLRPLDIDRELNGDAFLRDVHGRPFSCVLCLKPLSGALYRILVGGPGGDTTIATTRQL